MFDASVISATRNDTDTKWRLEFTIAGERKTEEFDKVAFCHGYQTKQQMPSFEGEEKYEGVLMHAQQFRSYVISINRRC